MGLVTVTYSGAQLPIHRFEIVSISSPSLSVIDIMSGRKVGGGGGAGTISGKPAMQSNSLFSYFGKATPSKATNNATLAAPNATPTSRASPNTISPMAARTPSPARPLIPPSTANRTPLNAPSPLHSTSSVSPSTPSLTSPAARLAGRGDGSAAVAASFFGGAKAAPVQSSAVFNAKLASAKQQQSASPTAFETSLSGRKRRQISYKEESDDGADDEEEEKPIMKKTSTTKRARRRKDDDEDYEDTAMPSADSGEDEEDGMSSSVADEEEEYKTPVKKVQRTPASSSKKSAPSSASSSFGSGVKVENSYYRDEGARGDATPGVGDGDDDNEGSAYDTSFLLPENRRDRNRRRPDQPGYDATSLYIPQEYWSKFTPAQHQYWEMKSANMDTVLFFKMGKFYELFDEDAFVGVKELGLTLMPKSRRPHAGFPESALTKYANQLVQLGYKIAQIDQTETPEELKAWNARQGRGDKKRKVVRREISSVLTPGTIVDGDVLGTADANYILAFTERQLSEEEKKMYEQETANRTQQEGAPNENEAHALVDEYNAYHIELGYCYADCTTGRIIVGQHLDDQQRSHLKQLLGFVSPREIIVPMDGLSRESLEVMKMELPPNVTRNDVQPGKEFWTAETTIREIEKQRYFDPEAIIAAEPSTSSCSTASTIRKYWPHALQQLVEQQQSLALSALGALIWYLRRTRHEHDILSMGNITNHAERHSHQNRLVLDGQTLSNLEILKNQDGTTKGTLLEFVDRTSTPFGKRLLREWLTAPLYHIRDIVSRQDAVQFFMTHADLAKKLSGQLRGLPDLERHLSRIHAFAQKQKVNVIMYEDVEKKQLDLFCKTIEGFERAFNILLSLFELSERSENEGMMGASDASIQRGGRIHQLINLTEYGGLLPPFDARINAIKEHFDLHKVKSLGRIIPARGMDEEYDAVDDKLKRKLAESEMYIKQLRRDFADMNIKYVHKGQEKYQIEIAQKTLQKKGIPMGFDLISSTKNVKRFWTKESKKLCKDITEAEAHKDELSKNLSRNLFGRFSEYYRDFAGAVQVIAELDCLLSLASVSQNHLACQRPEFVSMDDTGGHAMLELRQAYHPCLYETDMTNEMTKQQTQFVPNDTVIGCEENPARFVLVSGPNMGGKSTLLRQTCCAVILAQLGCWVPADRCRLTPCDRIFTRVGANDKIMQGQSTFLVELTETAVILKNATKRSLVILDELGRGTSTFDGTAIAYSVIQYLSREIDSMTLFSTHYHMLMDEFASDPLISQYHMECRVDESEKDDHDAAVQFLYKFAPGVSSKSYGHSVAKAAGLPNHVIQRAKTMTEIFERRCAEAMGRKRARISALFPQPKPGCRPMHPPSLRAVLARAIQDVDTDLILRIRSQLRIAQKGKQEEGQHEGKTNDRTVQQTGTTNTASMDA